MTKPFHVEHIGHARCYGCTRAEAKLDDMTLERDRLAARLESSNDTVASLQTELRDAFAETEAVKARLAEVERERGQFANRILELTNAVAHTGHDSAHLKAEVADLRKQLATAEALLAYAQRFTQWEPCGIDNCGHRSCDAVRLVEARAAKKPYNAK